MSRWRGAAPGGEPGNASIAVLSLAVMVMILIAGLGDLAIFYIARAKAQTAADSAALAAASELVPGLGKDPSGQALQFAAANGARLLDCRCRFGSRVAEVRVAVEVRFMLARALGVKQVGARAKAEVDLGRSGKNA